MCLSYCSQYSAIIFQKNLILAVEKNLTEQEKEWVLHCIVLCVSKINLKNDYDNSMRNKLLNYLLFGFTLTNSDDFSKSLNSIQFWRGIKINPSFPAK